MKTEQPGIERVSRIILALLVGILIWGAAIGSEEFSIEVKVPINLHIADAYLVMENSEDSVVINIRGSGLEMLNHQVNSPLKQLSRNIPVSNIRVFPGLTTVTLGTSDIILQGSLEITKVVPDQISITIDTLISRELPVSVQSLDGIPSRFSFLSVEPKSVTVTGPSSIVLRMDSVSTEVLDTSSGQVTASLAFDSDMVAYSESLVQVRFYEPAVPVIDN